MGVRSVFLKIYVTYAKQATNYLQLVLNLKPKIKNNRLIAKSYPVYQPNIRTATIYANIAQIGAKSASSIQLVILFVMFVNMVSMTIKICVSNARLGAATAY